MPKPVVVYDDMPPYTSHGWKYLADDHKGAFFIGFGPPFNIGIPPTTVSQIRRVNYTNGLAELVAEGVRNSVGGDVDPRSGDYWFTENARDWLSATTSPSDKLNHLARFGEHFGYPYCHQGDIPDPKFAMGHKCDEFTPPAVKLGAHVAPLGMKFYTGMMFPPEYTRQHLHRRARLVEPPQLSGRPHRARDHRSGWQERSSGSVRGRLDHRSSAITSAAPPTSSR